jgi:hypothetical protein
MAELDALFLGIGMGDVGIGEGEGEGAGEGHGEGEGEAATSGTMLFGVIPGEAGAGVGVGIDTPAFDGGVNFGALPLVRSGGPARFCSDKLAASDPGVCLGSMEVDTDLMSLGLADTCS